MTRFKKFCKIKLNFLWTFTVMRRIKMKFVNTVQIYNAKFDQNQITAREDEAC
jgi:hypothetical protein